MARAKEKTISLLGSGSAGMQTGDGKTTIYTVPSGKEAIITHLVIQKPTASLAGGTDFDFGDGANADTLKQAVDLSGLTASTDYIVIPIEAKTTIFNAGDALGIMPVTGSTADADATIEFWGKEQAA